MIPMMLRPLASIISIIGGSFLQDVRGVALPALHAPGRSPLSKGQPRQDRPGWLWMAETLQKLNSVWVLGSQQGANPAVKHGCDALLYNHDGSDTLGAARCWVANGVQYLGCCV